MAKTRVSELAKEYGMTGKEMLGYLKEMMIPAKTPSSTLEDAYVAMVRKKLKPILEARAAEIEAARKAEEEAKAAAEREAAAKAEAERLAAEERREKERKAAAEAQARAEEARRKAEEERKAEEARRAAEEEARRPKDTAPKSMPTFSSLLDQIAQQEEVLAQQAAEASQKKEEARGDRRSQGDVRRSRRDADAPAEPAREDTGRGGRGRGRKGRRDEDEGGDRYSRMARAAEEYNREHVLEEARQAVADIHKDGIITSGKTGESISDSVVIVSLDRNFTDAEAVAFAKKHNMTVVYNYRNFNMCALKLKTPAKTMAEMEKITTDLEKDENVLMAQPEHIMYIM